MGSIELSKLSPVSIVKLGFGVDLRGETIEIKVRCLIEPSRYFPHPKTCFQEIGGFDRAFEAESNEFY